MDQKTRDELLAMVSVLSAHLLDAAVQISELQKSLREMPTMDVYAVRLPDIDFVAPRPYHQSSNVIEIRPR